MGKKHDVLRRKANDYDCIVERFVGVICAISGVGDCVVESTELFHELRSKRLFVGFKAVHLIAACIYIVSKKNGLNPTKSYLSGVVGIDLATIDRISKRYYALYGEMHIC